MVHETCYFNSVPSHKPRKEERQCSLEMGDGGAVTSYHYTLICLVDGWDSSAEISEDELQSEIIAGYYNLIDEVVI